MTKLLNAWLLLTSLFGYLEWGGGNHGFLFEAEYNLLKSGFRNDPAALLNPAVIIPLAGQLMLLITLFQKSPGRSLTIFGLVCLSLIMLFILFIGITGKNIKIAGSTIPFVIVGVLVIRNLRAGKNAIR